MRFPKSLNYPFIAAGLLAFLLAVSVLVWDSLGGTSPEITAYCNVDGFVGRTYTSFQECDGSLKPDIQKYGYVCGCKRTDGIFGLVSRVTKWIM